MRRKTSSKNYIFCFLFLFCCITAHTQSFQKITWSGMVKPGDHSHLQGIYSAGEKFFMLFTDNEKSVNGFTLALLGPGENTTLLKHSFNEPVNAVLGAYAQGNNVVVLTENIAQHDGKFVQEIKSLTFDWKTFTEEKTVLSFESKNKTSFGKSRFTISPNGKRTLLFAEHPFRMGYNEEFTIVLIDENGIQTPTSFTIDIESRQYVHNYPQVADNGTVYFLKRDKNKDQQYKYFVYAYDPLTTSLTHKNISLTNNANISDIRGTVTPEGEFLVGGFISSEMVHLYEGYFLYKFDQQCNQKFKTQGNFDESTFLKFISKKEYNKNPGIPDFYIEHVSTGPTGKIFITSEYYNEKKVSDKKVLSLYNEVMLLCFSSAGDYKTAYNLKKEQTVDEKNTKWASYKTYYNNDSLFVLYNNLAKIEGSKTPEPVLQLDKVHERTGITQTGPSDLNNQAETPFFIPVKFTQPDNTHFRAVFTNLDNTTWRVAWVEL